MMELERITAQIFQRSEEKKKTLRVQKRRIAAGVVSLSLCVCLAVVFAPQLAHKNADSAPMPESFGGVGDPGTEKYSENSFSTQQDGQTANTKPLEISIQDPQKIALLTALLDFAPISPESQEDDNKAQSGHFYSSLGGITQAYFTCITKDGQTRYHLCNNVVTRLEDMSSKELTQEALSELYQLLELPMP